MDMASQPLPPPPPPPPPSPSPPGGPAAMASPLLESDTASASPGVSPTRSPPFPSQGNGTHSRKLTPTTSHHSRSQTFDNAITTAAPVAAPLPFRFSSPIRRKPVSSSASLLVTPICSQGSSPLSHITVDPPNPKHRFTRSPSGDSPTLYDYPAAIRSSVTAPHLSEPKLASSDDENETVTGLRDSSIDSDRAASETDFSDAISEYDDLISDIATPDIASANALGDESSDITSDIESIYTQSYNYHRNPSAPMFASKPAPPHLTLEKVDHPIADEPLRTLIDDSPQSSALVASPQLNKPLPRSPGQTSPLASFFGWGNPSPSTTDFSSIESPLSPAKNGLANDNRYSTNSSFSEGTKPDTTTTTDYAPHGGSYISTSPPSSSAASAMVDEMEEELKAISSELVASIRREIDLEDLVDKLQELINNQAPGKRTSDYFSDSGYNSVKFGEYDQNREDIERMQRKSEQEKASLRLELTSKLQDERMRRKELDQKIKDLAEKASEVDPARMQGVDVSGRVKELEITCEDLRQKISEQHQSNGNMRDVLSALKGELQDARNERDNLRDEVVPELRARVEGLESKASEYTNLTYESTRMQQELHSLKRENRSLRNSVVSGPEDIPKRMSAGLARSNSVATASFRGQRQVAFSISRSDSVKNSAQTDSRDTLLERLKDVEAQRDALHSALKSLLERQEFQNREHQKKVRSLENERQRLLTNSPRKAGFGKDLSKLRTEIGVLRRRAEDALEEKWQVEKGLGGLKMNLDRAEEEIESLRSLLKEKDILTPPFLARSSGSSETIREPVTSACLEIAYKELQDAYAESLERIKELELNAGLDEKAKLAVELLERLLSMALLERDTARDQADEHKAHSSELAANADEHMAAESALADELSETANRIERLASQVRQQLAANVELRERLSTAVMRGDADRKANSDRIAEMQEHLRHLEDQVVAAQTASEDRVGRHEEEVAALREAHNEQLYRLQNGRGNCAKAFQESLLSSSFLMPSKSFEEEAEMKTLRARVAELEKALADAENEMQEVVARINMAQVEVLSLQEDREAAVRETRRLEGLMRQEQSRAFGDFLATLSGKA